MKEKALEIAKSKVGMHEQGGPNQGEIVEWAMKPWSKVKPGSWAEWCAAFVCTCYWEAGSILVKKYGSTNVKTLWKNMQKIGVAWENYGTPSQKMPEPGDLVFFKGLNHVGMVESYDASTKTVHVIEGNSNDQVKRDQRPLEHYYGFASLRS